MTLLQLRKRDSGVERTHSIVVRLIILSIETGCVTGQGFPSLFWSISNSVTDIYPIIATLAAILLALVHLPGHPDYYIAVTFMLAKTYSNSMMANLNSRVKVISNSHSTTYPTWNESEKPISSIDSESAQRNGDFMFRRQDQTGFSSSCATLHVESSSTSLQWED